MRAVQLAACLVVGAFSIAPGEVLAQSPPAGAAEPHRDPAAAEALFAEGVNPWEQVADLDRETVERLVERVHLIINRGKAQAVQSTTGSVRPGETTYVYGRGERPCRRCGTTVGVAPIGRPPRVRTVFYCPSCQRRQMA